MYFEVLGHTIPQHIINREYLLFSVVIVHLSELSLIIMGCILFICSPILSGRSLFSVKQNKHINVFNLSYFGCFY